uniref:Uncharacterized protein n=1 Tax=uncultured bacterium Contig1753 TaxID=1393498 RepID=W0FNE0_9BACT|nr:hypothetical protein [uncultured bacterium Contig1753]
MRINGLENRYSLTEKTEYVIRTGFVTDHSKSSQK